MNYELCVGGSLLQRPGRTQGMFMVMDVKPCIYNWSAGESVRGPRWLGAQLERLTFLLDVQEAFHRPLAWGFIVLICRPYPLHQLLHFLLGAHKVVSCLCGKWRIVLSLHVVYQHFLLVIFLISKIPLFCLQQQIKEKCQTTDKCFIFVQLHESTWEKKNNTLESCLVIQTSCSNILSLSCSYKKSSFLE